MRIKGLKEASELRSGPRGSPFHSPDFQTKADEVQAIDTDFVIEESRDEAELNQLERDWLDVIRGRGYIWIGIHCISLKIGFRCWYRADFFVIDNGQLIVFETKGFMRDDAQVKLKAIPKLFPWLRLILVERDEHMMWKETEYKP